MRTPPEDVRDSDVRAAVRAHWDPAVTDVTYLPVGFGAHHWRAETDARPRFFVTLDGLEPRHTSEGLEATYAAAAALAAGGLDFVVPTVASGGGRRTVPFGSGALSMTPWVEGTPGVGVFADRAEAESTAAMLAALHAATPPPGIVAWSPLVPRGFAAELALTLAAAWDRGPYGERARRALDERLESIGGWVARYHRLASVAAERPWVPTHGEPDTGNQLLTASARVLVDWESLRLAPAERDLRTLTGSGVAGLCEPDWAMVELFDLEWRLDEIAGYARWFAAAHDGTRDDQIAYGGLLEELDRADWQRPEQ